MSYQTVTDINLLGSQTNFNNQIKDLVKDSSMSSSKSFEDLVSFYKDHNTEETKTASTESENFDKTEKVETEKEDVSTSKEVEKSETKESDKTEKSQENEKTQEGDPKEKTEVESAGKKEGEADDKKVKLSKEEKNPKEKKLSEKDFSRLDHIAGETAQAGEQAKVDAKDTKVKDLKAGEALEETETVVVDERAGVELMPVTAENQPEMKNNMGGKEDKNDFEPFSKSEKKEKVFFDKDGKIEVQDMRSDAGKIADAQADSKSKLKISEPKLVNENTAQMTIELNQNANANANVLSANNQAAGANGSNFQAMLNNQIQQAAPEFVKAGNLILKDNNQGTINLVLRPDDLGDVKLHLSLDGKNISGHITVATKEALEVFKDNAETLREAFIKNGFDSASFDVSYGGNQGGFNQEMAFEQQDGRELLAKKVYENGVVSSEEDLEITNENNDVFGEYSINIVA